MGKSYLEREAEEREKALELANDCPVCKERPWLRDVKGYTQVYCPECEAAGPKDFRLSEAIRKWNCQHYTRDVVVELKPCPKCGAPAEISSQMGGLDWHVCCSNAGECFGQFTHLHNSPEAAAEEWNSMGPKK